MVLLSILYLERHETNLYNVRWGESVWKVDGARDRGIRKLKFKKQ